MKSRSRSRSPTRSSQNWKRNSRGGDNHVRLFVTNLPYEMKWQSLKDLFKEEVGSDVLYANLYETDRRPSGSGIVEVRNDDAADKCIQKLNGHEVMGRKIIVREETSKDRQRFDSDHKDDNMDRRRVERPMDRPTGSFSVGLMNQLGIHVAEITNQVFVANLDYKVTRQKLEEVFRIAGNVIDAEIKVDKEGKSRGMGVVRFEHPIEAVQAISLFTSQMLYDRQMYVRMDRWVEPIMQDIPSRLPIGLKTLGVGMGANGKPLLNVAEIANTLTLSMLVADNNSQKPDLGALGGGGGGIIGRMGGGGGGGGGGGPVMGMGGEGMMMSNANNNPAPLMDQPANLIANMVSNLTSGGQSGMNMNPPMNNAGIMGSGNNNVSQQMQAQALLNALSSLSSNNNNNNNNNFMPNNNSFNSSFNNSASYNDNYPGQGDLDRNSTLFVKNLPYSFTTKDLYDRFKPIGDIKFAEVKQDAQGNSKGFALLQYNHSEDAHRAINNMNGARIDGRPIEVRFDRAHVM